MSGLNLLVWSCLIIFAMTLIQYMYFITHLVEIPFRAFCTMTATEVTKRK